MNKLGKILKELRLEQKITQNELANILNVKNTTISAWELGTNEPPLQAIEELARFFDVSADYLLGIDDNITYTNSGNHNTINGNGNNINSPIKHVVNGSTTLSKDEQELIENFRKLSKDKQQSILNLTK